MLVKYTLDILTQDSVSVKIQKYIIAEEMEYNLAEPHRKKYTNSVVGRSEVENELPLAQKNAIFSVWGNKPTVIEGDVNV